MKKLIFLGLLLAFGSVGAPRVAQSLGYESVSIQDSMLQLKEALSAVTKTFER